MQLGKQNPRKLNKKTKTLNGVFVCVHFRRDTEIIIKLQDFRTGKFCNVCFI